jgi:hypothetical protein
MRGQQLALARPKPFRCCRSDLQDHLGIVSAFRRNARGQYNTVDVHSAREYYHEQMVLSRLASRSNEQPINRNLLESQPFHFLRARPLHTSCEMNFRNGDRCTGKHVFGPVLAVAGRNRQTAAFLCDPFAEKPALDFLAAATRMVRRTVSSKTTAFLIIIYNIRNKKIVFNHAEWLIYSSAVNCAAEPAQLDSQEDSDSEEQGPPSSAFMDHDY